MVYQYMYSPNGSMHGFVNHTLSHFNVSHFQKGKEPQESLDLGYTVEICRWAKKQKTKLIYSQPQSKKLKRVVKQQPVQFHINLCQILSVFRQ